MAEIKPFQQTSYLMLPLNKYLEKKSNYTNPDTYAAIKMCTQFTFACATATLLVTFLLAFITPIPLIVSLLGVFISGFLYILWFLFKEGILIKYSNNILLVASKLILLPKIFITGGIYSELIPLALILPFIFMLLGGFYHAFTAIVFWTISWLILFFIGEVPFDLTNSVWNEGKAASITLWLVATNILSLMVILKIENINRRQQKSLLKIANSDVLTDVHNRRGLIEILQKEMDYCVRNKQVLSLLFIDIDHFKRFNDNNGHEQGDIALKRVAACLKEQVRKNQDTVARFGGEEFVVLLRDTQSDKAFEIAEKMRSSIKSLQMYYDTRTKSTSEEMLSITIGLYSTNCINETQKSILKKADQALYFGKENGRDQVVKAQQQSK